MPVFSPGGGDSLYTRVRAGDPERMGGTQVSYRSFDDFVTTFEAEAKDPTRVGAADVLDVINPLQHLPLISSLYRELTGDQIKPGARMIGDTAFGGGVGLASGAVNAAVQHETGRDVGETVVAALTSSEAPPVMVAENTASVAPTPVEKMAGGTVLDGGYALAQQKVPAETAPVVPVHAVTLPGFSGYRTLGAETIDAQGVAYTRVAMADPERMAGSFVAYA